MTAPPATSLLAAVEASLTEAKIGPVEAGAAELARRYAAAIDASEDPELTLEKLGPRLLAALIALGAPSPATAAKATEEPKTLDPLAALRARRRTG